MSNDASERKQRSDKGLIMATRRDLYCIKWIAEQYAAKFDQIQKLLSRFPDGNKPFKNGKLIAETTTKDLIARWQRAGWVEYKRVLADGRGFAWATKKGLALVDLDETFTARVPAPTRLAHIYAVNQVRLWMDLQGFEWTSERCYRATLEKGKKGETTGPIPDAVVMSSKFGKIAIEVELTSKKPAELFDKLVHLVRATAMDTQSLRYTSTFPVVWFYVPDEKIKGLVESARSGLQEREQGRVSAGVQPDLIA
jgi:hypothetical protein